MAEPGQTLRFSGGETAIRRDADGRWYDGDEPIAHPGIERAFDRWLDRADDGRYCLRNSINWAYVRIDGAPVFVRAVRHLGDRVELTLSDGRGEPLDPRTLRQDDAGRLYCDVREGRLPARFDRSAAFQLAEVLAEDAAGLYLELGGIRVRPPVSPDPLSPRASPTGARPPGG